MPPLPERISPTLKAIQDRRIAEHRQSRGSTFIAASEAAHPCARAIWYAFHWATPLEEFNGRMLRLFGTGEMEEARILDDLAKIEGVEIHTHDDDGKQFKSVIEGYIATKPDAVMLGVLEAPKTWHVVEAKTANDRNFKKIKSKGVKEEKPDHYLQMQLEMRGLGLTRALYYVVNKNDDEEYVERVRLDVEFVEREIARLLTIANAPRPPGKLHDDPNAKAAWLCRYCRHKPICHDGEFAQRNCRTCIFSTAQRGGDWRCDKHRQDLIPETQAEGCADQRFIPDLVPGEQVDIVDGGHGIVYRLSNGEAWEDRGP